MAEVPRNPYLPRLVRVAAVRDETRDVRTLRLEFLEPAAAADFRWAPGQFGEISVFGAGECVLTLAGTPEGAGAVECTVRAVGRVTRALYGASPGQVLGLRGPYGHGFDVGAWRGRDLVFVGGGIGMAALRAPLQAVLARRDAFGEVVLLNGARSVADLVYRGEMEAWGRQGIRVVRTVDPGGQTRDWDGEVGLLPEVFERLGLGPAGRLVVVCGPPVMLRAMFRVLEHLGFGPEQVVTTLENRMKCGLGLCGRCNIGRFYVCVDGPVISWSQLRALPPDL